MAQQPTQENERVSQDKPRLTERMRVTVLRNRQVVVLAIIFGILLVAALFVLLGFALNWYLFGPTPGITKRKDLVQGLASVIQALAVLVAGVVGLAGLYFTRRTLLHNQEALRTNQENTQQTLALTEQGQITERFTRAIDQLGATHDNGEPKLEIRLGGIYALERLAKDSPEKDYAIIMEVLTAYVRENAQLPSEQPTESPSEQDETAEQSEDAKQSSASKPQEDPRTDIQAALDVLGRRQEEHRVRLDLQKTNLTRARLQSADLRGADLREADLQRADLQGADLREADLCGAYLRRASLREAIVREADLRRADLLGADLWGAIVRGADLREADLQRADLREAHLEGAKLEGAKLEGAYLMEADLRRADLTNADLTRADLQKATLANADLREANLQRADLRGLSVFGGAFRIGSQEIVAEGLTQEQLEQASGDENTKLPEGLEIPKSWIQG